MQNRGGFYSTDDVMNPMYCQKWLAFKEEDKKKKGQWEECLPEFRLTKIAQPRHLYLDTGDAGHSIKQAFQVFIQWFEIENLENFQK